MNQELANAILVLVAEEILQLEEVAKRPKMEAEPAVRAALKAMPKIHQVLNMNCWTGYWDMHCLAPGKLEASEKPVATGRKWMAREKKRSSERVFQPALSGVEAALETVLVAAVVPETALVAASAPEMGLVAAVAPVVDYKRNHYYRRQGNWESLALVWLDTKVEELALER